MELRIPFARVECDGNELTYLREVLDSGWLTTASKAAAFEDRFRNAVGAAYACAVNSCTAALHLAADAVGIGPGDRVLVPTMTFTATAEVIRYLGADPVFLDVDYGSCLVTRAIIEEALAATSRPRAAMIVHFGGQPAQMVGVDGQAGILDLCGRLGIRVIEDAAHAFPARIGGRMIGSLGDATCFSFYANKTITTGEGGLLATNDAGIFERARVMRLHGINRDVWDRFTSDRHLWEYDVVAPGFKYNLPDVAAAIGLAQLERADEAHRQRQRCAAYYYEHLGGLECVDLPARTAPMEDQAWHLFWLVLNDKSPVPRNRFIELMNQAGIGTSVHYKPLHRLSYYRDRYNLRAEDFPNAERHWKGCVSLPIYASLTDDELEYICDTVTRILGRA